MGRLRQRGEGRIGGARGHLRRVAGLLRLNPEVASNTSNARYVVLVPNPDKLPKKDATKEPTYRLRKAMKLV